MPTETLVLMQLCIALTICVVILFLILRRQKQTIQKLQDILLDVKDEFSGEALVKHLQREVDNTTAHCRQQTIAFKGDLSEEDLAIAVRFNALNSELNLAKMLTGDTKLPWRVYIAGYLDLAAEITSYNNDRIENSAKILNEVYQEELDNNNAVIETLSTAKQNLTQQVDELKPLQSFIKLSTDGDNSSRLDLEQAMHKALLTLCDNFTNSENLRELVFLIHEAFHESDTVKELILKEAQALTELDPQDDNGDLESAAEPVNAEQSNSAKS